MLFIGVFKIDVNNLEWIGGQKDDPEDLCLHGNVKVQIGETTFEAVGTVGATALYLLKTLTKDKIASEHEIQMIPCCGFFMIANNDLTEVDIIGCDTGTDWSVIHVGSNVKLILANGQEEVVNFKEYQKEVFKFADKIEEFYLSCSQKILPTDEFDRNGYIAFWNEWHRRRGK